jgi:hypothetical protein
MRSRHARILGGRIAEISRLQRESMRTRGQLIARESSLAIVREELERLRATVPDFPTRNELARRVELQCQRIHVLERERVEWRLRADQAEGRLAAMIRERAFQEELLEHAKRDISEVSDLKEPKDKAVLCVGGRTSNVPAYRQLIEHMGGRFMHVEVLEEENVELLETSLASADLVICQTGCISHDAYWRVDEFCKRTGKRCVYVDKPSEIGQARSLQQVDVVEVSDAERK